MPFLHELKISVLAFFFQFYFTFADSEHMEKTHT